VVAASDVDRTGRSVVEESAGGPAVLRPDARAAGRSWPVRVLLALPTFGLLFGLVTGVIGLGVLLAIDASSTVSSSVATSALLVSFAVGLIPGVLFGTRLWSGQTRPTGFHLIVGELGAQWVCQDRGAVTSTAARYDGEEAWVHDMTRHVRAGQTMARTEALSVCDATGVVKRPTVVADGWMISAVMPVALRARAAARVPIVKERLGRGESVRFWFIGENPAPLVLHADRIEFRGTSLPRSGLTTEVVQGTGIRCVSTVVAW
jgi:hypothetical protein